MSLKTYFSPASRAARARNSERRCLIGELRSITASRIYGYTREQSILQRLSKLDMADAGAVDLRCSK